MDIDFEALLQSFLAESEEGLSSMEEALMILERQPRDEEALGMVFRIAHTIKGTAAMFDFTAVERLAHVLEELLDRLRGRSLPLTGELASLLLRAVDVLRVMILEAAAGNLEMGQEGKSILDQLRRASAGQRPAMTPGEQPAEVFAPELTEPPANRSRSIDRSAEAALRSPGSLRVDLRKLDRLLSLTGEIGIARGRLAQMLEEPGAAPAGARHSDRAAAALEALREADVLHSQLQELVMKLRMVPIGPTFRRYRRTVRDLAEKHGKVARLDLEGEHVEVDATVIEHLRDPLTHMVRNALDHGIELPETRSAAGKDRCGLVTLEARHEAGSIVIELSDDGAGLDRQRILERAQVAGVAPHVFRGHLSNSDLTEQGIEQLIFEPGLSTTDTVTDLSGRGVGMDVVRRNLDALRGSVSLTSRPGLGTTVTMRLPLTLAIIDGFQVTVDDQTYIVPLDVVVETLAFQPSAARRADGRGVINLRGVPLPCVRLRELLCLGGTPPARESILVVRYLGGIAGLIVDALLGESQTVIKPMAKLLRGLPGISGSTILDNGMAAFILYVPHLLRRESACRPAANGTHAAA